MLVIFDLEGVLVDGEFLPALAKLKGNYEIRRIVNKQNE